jgi:hypothetical protein
VTLLGAIVLIETWVDESGGADQAICHDMKARSAVERQLLIISEAAVPSTSSTRPRLTDWHQISTGLGFEALGTSSDTHTMISTRRYWSMSSEIDSRNSARHASARYRGWMPSDLASK